MTAVVVCRSGAHVEDAPAPGNATLVLDLCRSPAMLRDAVDGTDELVLAVHPEDLDGSLLQAAIRRAGFDPFGVPLIDIAGAAGDGPRLEVMVAGAVARAQAFAGSRPEQAKPVMSGEVSRRALLTIPRPYYQAVPAVDQAVCASGDGCRACVDLCPRSAYRLVGRRIVFDKEACVACGLCVTGCPTGAIENPSVSPAALKAQVEAIVDAAESAGIVFVCERSTVPMATPDWYAVAVPCSAMVPGTWLVAALLLGAAAVTIRPCGEGGCPVGFDERSASALATGRGIAVGAGLRPETVPERPGDLPAVMGLAPVPLTDPFGVHGAAEVVLALAATDGPVDAEAQESPVGIVDVDADTCTLCTMCAETCPTGALEHGYEDGMMTLSFDAALCTGCAQCLPACPEIERGTITLRRRADSVALAAGRLVVQKTETVACESCGRPIAPAATLDRIAALLGDEHADTARYLATRCIDCRGLG